MGLYLDYNATSPLDQQVIKAMEELGHIPLNPSSTHIFGRNARNLLEKARNSVKAALNAKDDTHIIFTASCTEANNTVMHGLDGYYKIVSSIEHASIISCAKHDMMLKVDSNSVADLFHLEAILKNAPKDKPIMISLMLANNETGAIQPIKEAVKIAKQYNAIVHTDATQAVGRIPIDIADLGVDILTFSGHKIGGPHGSAAIILKKDIPLKPLLYGGGQEYRLRSGTHNLPAIIGLGAACENIKSKILKYQAIKPLMEMLIERIIKSNQDIKIAARLAKRISNTISITTTCIPAAVQIMYFDLKGICVSAGSACTSGIIEEPSHVYLEMGYTVEEAKSTIRVSFGPEHTQEDFNKFFDIWKEMRDNVSLNQRKVI